LTPKKVAYTFANGYPWKPPLHTTLIFFKTHFTNGGDNPCPLLYTFFLNDKKEASMFKKKQRYSMALVIVLLLAATVNVNAYGATGNTEKLAVIHNIQKPRALDIRANRLFISQGFIHHVYAPDTFVLQTKIGKRGEGPGEFKSPPRYRALKDSIFADTVFKCAWFALDGTLIKEIKKTSRGFYIPIQNKYVFSKISLDFKKRIGIITVSVMDEQYNIVKAIASGEEEDVNIHLSSDTGKETKIMIPHYFAAAANSSRIFVADSKQGFFISVFDTGGNKIKTITRKPRQTPVPESFKKEAMQALKQTREWPRIRNNQFLFYEFFPEIKGFMVDDKYIYVETHKKEGEESRFLVLDMRGRLVKEVYLPAEDTEYVFYGGFYYYLKENEETEDWELFRERIL
jgi:hypothetical protein